MVSILFRKAQNALLEILGFVSHHVVCCSLVGIVSPFTGKFVYFTSVGFPGSVHDKRMYDEEILSMCPAEIWEWGIGDKGYEGAYGIISPWKGMMDIFVTD